MHFIQFLSSILLLTSDGYEIFLAACAAAGTDTEDIARQELEVALGIPVQQVNAAQFVISSTRATTNARDGLISTFGS